VDTQPPPVAHPVMYRQWNRITFLHRLRRYAPEAVQPFLPAGVRIGMWRWSGPLGRS
jgi:hypothetical protein